MVLNPVIAISGVVHSAREVEVTSVAQVEAMGSPPGESTGLTALLDAEGRVLARGAVKRLRTHGGCGCEGDEDGSGYPYAFEAYVPGTERGAQLQVSDGTEALWERAAQSKEPEMGELSVRADDESLHVAWSGEAAEESTREV